MTIVKNQRALIIAIRYTGQSWRDTHEGMELEGCHNDADEIINHLCDHENYDEQDIRLLADIPGYPSSKRPTRGNILEGIKWLVDGCRSGDKRFFYYSGHGMQVKDKNGDEKDGYDEGIIPCDWSTQCNVDIIIDDDLRKFLVEPLPKGANLTALFDCCHSGTILDMDQETNPQAIGETLSKVADGAVKIRSFYTAVQANVVCWSACTDAQKAYESRSGRSVMTEAFTKHVQSLKGSSLLAVGKAIYSEVERSAERLGHQDPQLWVSVAMQHLGGLNHIGVGLVV